MEEEKSWQNGSEDVQAELKEEIETLIEKLNLPLVENWLKSHRLMFNPKLKCLASNIIFQIEQKDDTAR